MKENEYSGPERRRQQSFMDRWREVIISGLSLVVAGSIAWGALNTKVCKLQEERIADKAKIDQMADDVSYLRGQWDMYMQNQRRTK